MRTEVAVVGLGPVGGVLASLLAAAGVDVTVVEPTTDVFPVPRAVALDDEVLRFLASVPALPPVQTVGRPRAELVTGGGRLIAAMDFDGARNGHPGLGFFHQPTLESQLRSLLDGRVLADAVVSIHQAADDVELRLASGSTLTARYVVGCDGASSTVRGSQSVAFPGRTLPRPWLVVDAVGKPIADTFRYVCEPAAPAVSMPVPGGHRWETMRTGSREYSPHVPVGLTVTRSVEYTFSARTAERWRVGRVLLAGDAAHVMPPFAGQGLGAGLRDVAALWWRLVAALQGVDELDGYESERRPHVRAMTRTALLAGAVVQTRSRPAAVAVRGALKAAGLTPWFRRGGLRPRDRRLVPNVRVDVAGDVRRLDGWLPFGEYADLRLTGSRQVAIGDVVGTDLDGWLLQLLRRRDGAVRVRPDRVLT
jgi:3-(3-hydroxy-phenyl)propionate hydroxylase